MHADRRVLLALPAASFRYDPWFSRWAPGPDWRRPRDPPLCCWHARISFQPSRPVLARCRIRDLADARGAVFRAAIVEGTERLFVAAE
jgi:hypothetical protein